MTVSIGDFHLDILDNRRPQYRQMTCAFCGQASNGLVVATKRVIAQNPNPDVYWLQCSHCGKGAVDNRTKGVWQSAPTQIYGEDMQGLPTELESAYTEARVCFSNDAYTACELLCRKILMHIGVEKGAKEGGSFAGYVDHIVNAGYITKSMEPWVDLIRKHGNKATHKLDAPSRERAESTLMFTTQLLRLVYEMTFLVQKHAPTKPAFAN